MEISIEEIQKKFENLPEDLKWAIMASNIDDKIIDIGQSHELNVAQMGQLSLEAHMVIFGLIHPDKFEESLKGSLRLSDEKIKAITADVNNKILRNIREKFMSLYEKKEGTQTEENKIEIKKIIPPDIKPKISENNDILKKAGIEIMPEELGAGKVQSIPASKLTEPTKMAKTTTEYTLNNISKSSGDTTEKNKVVDPYRMPIE